ncbi:hypothetical protein [Kitasatospora sp. NPDC004272]
MTTEPSAAAQEAEARARAEAALAEEPYIPAREKPRKADCAAVNLRDIADYQPASTPPPNR